LASGEGAHGELGGLENVVLALKELKLGLGECGGVTLEFNDLGLGKLKRFDAEISGISCQPSNAPFAAPAMTI
jgi:hypothetical protein